MNAFLEYTVYPLQDEELRSMLIALLDASGYSGFIEEEQRLIAYIDLEKKNEVALRQMIRSVAGKGIEFSRSVVETKNWNEEWERSFAPVLIDQKVMVRASFHPKPPADVLDILVEPKMSFGTGHHSTTRLMIRALLDLDIGKKRIADLGCGTGVLSILARKLGAAEVLAVDTDEWAVTNTLENIALNRLDGIQVINGSVGRVIPDTFDCILANINKNTLLDEMDLYHRSLGSPGQLIMSGFLDSDAPAINTRAADLGFTQEEIYNEENWIAAIFSKNM
jgi:ribosomal protein L11 methyltransferase